MCKISAIVKAGEQIELEEKSAIIEEVKATIKRTADDKAYLKEKTIIEETEEKMSDCWQG